MKYFLILFLPVFIINCQPNYEKSDFLKPEWEGIDTSQLEIKFGDLLNFQVDSQLIKAVVLDFDSDEGGIWFGCVLMNEGRLFGRKIPNGMKNLECIDLQDFIYFNERAKLNFSKSSNLSIDLEKLGIGSRSPINNWNDLLNNYKRGLEQRKKKTTPCNEDLLDPNAVRECYFNIEYFLTKKTDSKI